MCIQIINILCNIFVSIKIVFLQEFSKQWKIEWAANGNCGSGKYIASNKKADS